MITDVLMPKLGVEMTAARLTAWHCGAGEPIEQGAVLLTVETEKVNFDVPAPASGLVHPIARVDEELPVGGLLARIAETADEYRALAENASGPTPFVKPPGSRDVPAGGPGPGLAPRAPVRATPLARKVARQAGLDIETLTGSGVRGQIREADVRRAIEAIKDTGPAPGREPAAPAAARAVSARAVHRRVPFRGMRQVIARRLHEGLQATAQMTDLGEIDVSELVRCRDQLKLEPALVGGSITYTDLFIKLAALVLREQPQFNASVEGDEIVEWADVNVGFATSVEGGLVVPVIRQADVKSLTEIRAERAALVERAKAGALRLEDVTDGTFTITNFGTYGSWMGTPLINPPQVAILGLGEVRQKPAVHEGQIVPRWLMGYGLTIDHRVLDGADAGRFLRRVRELCERPWVLLVAKAGAR